MSQFLPIAIVAALIFGICYLVDKAFTKLFRSKAQHRSGKAVRLSKRYGIFGVMLCVLGVLAMSVGSSAEPVLFWGGVIVLLMGISLAVYYLSFGIFYNEDTFLQSRFGRKDVAYTYEQILSQKLYLVQGGNIIVELHLADGNAVSLQSSMDGIYPFLDFAFAAWCRQTGRDPESCPFHDPSQSLWFPAAEDI